MPRPSWTFLTNHAFVLLALRRSEGVPLRLVAAEVGISERAVQQIVADLVEAGYVTRQRSGRLNRYEVDEKHPLRHKLGQAHTVGALVALLEETRDVPQRSSDAVP